MKKVSLVVCLAVTFVVAASWTFAGQGPETVDLKAAYKVEGNKKAVLFPHHKHQEKVECAKCHKNVKGGGSLVVDIVKLTTSSNDFHKKFCWPCHVDMKVAKGKSCTTCHH